MLRKFTGLHWAPFKAVLNRMWPAAMGWTVLVYGVLTLLGEPPNWAPEWLPKI